MEDYAAEVRFLHKLGLTEQMVRDHVIRPNHLKDAVLHIELHDAGEGADDPATHHLLQDSSTGSTFKSWAVIYTIC